MTSIKRTAYPLLRQLLSARELHVFYTPTPEEAAWARMTSADLDRLDRLLEVVWPEHTSAFKRLKKLAKRASWSHSRRNLSI